jgi:hypothetical protein
MDSKQEAIETISINGVEYVKKSSLQPVKAGNEVIVRTYSAGVHIGEIESEDLENHTVTLKNARILFSWKGALTLREVASRGVDRQNSKITANCLSTKLQWIEIIKISEGVDLTPTEK